MRLDEATWPVLDDLVERLTEERSADTRRRYQRAAAHLLSVLTSDDLPGDLDVDAVVRAVPAVLERIPPRVPVGRAYLVLVERLTSETELVRGARVAWEATMAARPPDQGATRIPDKWRDLMTTD